MIKHDELLDMWEIDGKIDQVDLGAASRNIPKIHAKYLNILISTKANRIATLHKIESLKKDLEMYYSGQAPAEVYKEKPFHTKLTKSGVEKHVNTDPSIIKLRDKLEYMDVIIEATEYIMKQISQQNFVIKNIVEFEKFRSGII